MKYATMGLIVALALPVTAQESLWLLSGDLADGSTNNTFNDAIYFETSGYGTTNGFGSPDFQSVKGIGSGPVGSYLGTALLLHENDATGRFQRLLVSSAVLGTAPSYSTNWSMALWFYRMNWSNADFLVFSGFWDGFGSGAGSPELEVFGRSDGVIQARQWNTSGALLWDIQSPPALLQQWHHMALIYSNNSYIALYVDGVLAGAQSGVDPDPAFNLRSTIFFGGIRHPGVVAVQDRSLNGYIDHIGIWTNAFSSNQVWSLYNAAMTNPVIANLEASVGNVSILFTPFPGAVYRLQSGDLQTNWMDMGLSVTGAVVSPTPQSITINTNLARGFFRLSL